MGGNAGDQTLAVAIRSLAMDDIQAFDRKRICLKELLMGLVNGLLTGFIAAIAPLLGNSRYPYRRRRSCGDGVKYGSRRSERRLHSPLSQTTPPRPRSEFINFPNHRHRCRRVLHIPQSRYVGVVVGRVFTRMALD